MTVPALQKEDIELVHTTFYWDGIAYKGHAWVKGYYCLFKGGPDFNDEGHIIGQGWTFYPLEGNDLVYALASRKLHEDSDKNRPESNGCRSDYYKDPKWQGIRDRCKEIEERDRAAIGEYAETFDTDW